MMKGLGRWWKVLAVAAALSLPLTTLRPVVRAAEKADRVLDGKILSDDGSAIEGARVKVRNVDTGEEFTSAPTGADGAYKLDKLPPGRYEVAVQTERGVYLGNRIVDLVDKTAQSYSFSLKNVPPEQALEEARRVREEEGIDDKAPAPPPTGRPETGAGAGISKVSYWSNPWTATLTGLGIAIGAAVVIDNINDDDDDGSPN